MNVSLFSTLLVAVVSFTAASTARADGDVIELRIKQHKFSNERIVVKANQPFKLKITNDDVTSEEFESRSMIVEKFIGPKRTLNLTLGPLKPGTYDFFGDFHMDTAKGVVVAE